MCFKRSATTAFDLKETTLFTTLNAWGGGTPNNGLYREALPERGTFIQLQVFKRVGISQVEVYNRVGKSVI